MPVGIRHRFRGVAAAAAAIAATAGVVAAAPAAPAAASPHDSDPTIIVRAGGDRTTDQGDPAGLAGVTFRATGANGATGTCVTGGDGTCEIHIANVGVSQTYTVAPESTPSGWFSSHVLGVGTAPLLAGNMGSVYDTITTPSIVPGATYTVPTAVNVSTNNLSREGRMAFSRTEHGEPTQCGLKVALVFDLSYSITTAGALGQYRAAGQSFVDALQGTPSSIAVYTFGTNAPADSAGTSGNNNTLQSTPVSTAAGANTVRSKIGGLTVEGAQYTNWDAGLWQVARSNDHYDDVIVLTDGDPTRNGRLLGNTPFPAIATTRFIDVENGIFSANALKTQTGTSVPHTEVVAVGIDVPSPGSHANLAAITGPEQGTDYFTTSFEELARTLDGLAHDQCEGSVNVTKLVVPHGQPDAEGTPTQGWEFHSTHPEESRETDETGSVSFHTGESTTPTTITETPREGYTPLPDRTSCRNTETGEDVDIDHVENGFTVEPDPVGIITCQVYNEAPPPHPAISIEKTADPTEYGAAGELITFRYRVANTGNVPLNNITLEDSNLGHVMCPREVLDVGEEMECIDTHITTEEDVAAGHIHNVAIVTGHTPEGVEPPTVTDEDEATVTVDHGPGIQLDKTAFPTEYAVPGEVIQYTYRVTNTGNVPLHDITLADIPFGEIDCPNTTLEPAASMDCTITHTITQSDVEEGFIHNEAEVSGLSPRDERVSDSDDALVNAIHQPGLEIEKTASPATFSAAGQRITYIYRVGNVGNVTLHDITVADSRLGPVTCPRTTLAPGAEMTCTATSTTTQADVARGHIPNFAFVRGDKPDGSSITSPRAEAIVTGPAEVPVTG